MSDLKKFYENNSRKDLNKWHHYFDIYEENLSKYRKQNIILLEIGVWRGGSLRMWQNYFNENSLIVGIDNNPQCQKFEKDNLKIFIGDQTDIKFLEKIIKEIGQPDIIIDDGGHTANQQITSFNFLYFHLKYGGKYIIEDTHTSYNNKFMDRSDKMSFMDFAKIMADKLNDWYQKYNYNNFKKELNQNIDIKKIPYITKNTHSINFYNSMVVFEKQIISTPKSEIR